MRTSSSRSGFSLIEMLLAVALLGGVLLALNLFVFSMADIWDRNGARRLFDQHVRAVTRHVEVLFRRAVPAEVAPAEIQAGSGGPVPLLAFELPAGDRVLPWPGPALPDVVCALDAQRGRGLVLYWHSRLETRFEQDPPRAVVLTPLATGLTYDYYERDTGQWRRESRPRRGSAGHWLAPECITLRFAQGELQAETTVMLPVTTGALPAF